MKNASFKSMPYSEALPEVEANEEDIEVFERLTSITLSEQEKTLAIIPDHIAPEEKRLMALHFHPEWVPLELIERRLQRSFPHATDRLIIPTQHNMILPLEPWAGVEADVYVPEYQQKIHLLIHLKSSVLKRAGVFQAMIERTFRYRASQLMDILQALTNPDEAMSAELKKSGLDAKALQIAGRFSQKLFNLIQTREILSTKRSEMLKNRLLVDFMTARGCYFPPKTLERALAVVKIVKGLVKRRLNPNCFYAARELIEEARSLGAGVVIPHPPLFWPALLDDLDVDGWEVWNPSTPNQTIFLIDCLARMSQVRPKLLAFMGDDTHMSSKIRPNLAEDKRSLLREIGFQPPWQQPKVMEALKAAGQSRDRTLDEYRARIS
ncbi:MAG: hypothetical protein LBT62_01150 [Deltaproteobacteria bacterium]|jgi:hypothetical protein|nr:hypothetical protein [Deltaproteobacteria bacterium]